MIAEGKIEYPVITVLKNHFFSLVIKNLYSIAPFSAYFVSVVMKNL